MEDNQDSAFVFFAKRLEYVPRYVMDYFFGLLAAMVSDVIITTITLASVALGLAIGHWLLVTAFFFTLYSLLRIASIVANAIGSSGQVIAGSLRQSQPPMIFQGGNQMPPPPFQEEPPPPSEGLDNGQPRIPVTLPPA